MPVPPLVAAQALALASALGAALPRRVCRPDPSASKGCCPVSASRRRLPPRPLEILHRVIGGAVAAGTAADAARRGCRDVGRSRDRIPRSAGRLAAARSQRTGLVRRSQGTRVQEESAAAATLLLPGADQALRRDSLD